jgi:hypothetical protein
MLISLAYAVYAQLAVATGEQWEFRYLEMIVFVFFFVASFVGGSPSLTRLTEIENSQVRVAIRRLTLLAFAVQISVFLMGMLIFLGPMIFGRYSFVEFANNFVTFTLPTTFFVRSVSSNVSAILVTGSQIERNR